MEANQILFVIYFYYNSNLWEGHQITFSQNIATKPHLVTYNNSLYLLYENYDSSQGGGTEVFLMKCQLPSSFIPPVQNLSEPLLFNMAQNYPNLLGIAPILPFRLGNKVMFALRYLISRDSLFRP